MKKTVYAIRHKPTGKWIGSETAETYDTLKSAKEKIESLAVVRYLRNSNYPKNRSVDEFWEWTQGATSKKNKFLKEYEIAKLKCSPVITVVNNKKKHSR